MTSRTGPMLTALAANPEGLTAVELAAWFASRPDGYLIDSCSTILRQNEARGYVERTGGMRPSNRGRPIAVWRITGAGLAFLKTCRTPLADLCWVVLAILGHPATARQIQEWMEHEGDKFTWEQVDGALRGLARKKDALMERASGRGVWQLTERGHAAMAAD